MDRLTDERLIELVNVSDNTHWRFTTNEVPIIAEELLELRKENEKLRELLTEIACSGVEYEDKRIDYVVVQVDRTIWKEDLNEFRPGD